MNDYPDMTRSALAYASRGFAVFPLQEGGKVPLPLFHDRERTRATTWNVDGHGAELLGSTDPARIREMWMNGRKPFNIGVALRYCAAFVIDIDERNGGVEWLDDHPELASTGTLQAVTARGGRNLHLWFQWDERLRGLHVTGIGEGADVKGIPYGFVVAPPSVIESDEYAGRYEWDYGEDDGFLDSEILPAPEWLLERLVQAGSMKRSGGAAPQDVELQQFELGKHAVELGAVRFKCGPGKWSIECPNHGAHTDRGRHARSDSSTVIFAPSPGKSRGWLHCSHSHCAHVKDFSCG